MTKRITMVLLMLAAPMVMGPLCKKEEPTANSAETPPPPAPTTEVTDAGAAGSGEVASYPTQIPFGGTVRLLRSFQVYQAADPASKQLGGLAAGTLVDLKASFSNWMLIMWPSGVGQLSPGWIQLPNINDSSVTVVQRDAGVADAAVAVVDAAVPVVDAGALAVDAGRRDGGRPLLRIPRR